MPDSAEFIIFWKDHPGQQVSTVVDAHNQPVARDTSYLDTNGICLLEHESDVLDALNAASGVKYAVTRDLARKTLGWDV